MVVQKSSFTSMPRKLMPNFIVCAPLFQEKRVLELVRVVETELWLVDRQPIAVRETSELKAGQAQFRYLDGRDVSEAGSVGVVFEASRCRTHADR